jgi:hypothetical protein
MKLLGHREDFVVVEMTNGEFDALRNLVQPEYYGWSHLEDKDIQKQLRAFGEVAQLYEALKNRVDELGKMLFPSEGVAKREQS